MGEPCATPPVVRFHPMAVPSADQPSTYYRKGFGLKADVQDTLASDYNGRIVDLLLAHEHTLTVGDVTVRLAKEFGFCYGVERAVEYAYQTRTKFPDRRLILVGEIIHNPHVNSKLRSMGIEILERGDDGSFDFSHIRADDVVIMPAFGVTIDAFESLRAIGCVLVDTTCGSVLNVWKRVDAYGRDGFTALIHGKYKHEETRATASQMLKYGGHYIIVRHMSEAQMVCDFIEGRLSRAALLEHFAPAVSPGFDPDKHLRRVGVANQTTMLARESLAIGEAVGDAIARARGSEARATDFRTFDTICSATQERQDAVVELLKEPLDAMVVIGGFNSSNTISLAALCAEHVPTYHIEDADDIDAEAGTIHFRVAGVQHVEDTRAGWLRAEGPVRIGLTAGASTPNNKIGETVAHILATRGGEIDA
jgi:4-hydroxy-3-methylbut-2-enyl diphosphate reductase